MILYTSTIIDGSRTRSLVELVLGPIGKLLKIPLGFLHHRFHALRMVVETLIIDHVLKNILGRLEVVPAPVEPLLADELLLLIMQPVEVRMSQALLHSVTFVRVESQHFGEQVSCSGLDVGEQLLPVLLRSLRQ
jgi:hypothetical protein